MKRTFTASVVREGDWFVAQCLEVDVASQGESLDDAVANLKEALELHFAPPTATSLPDVRSIEVELGAASAAAVSRGQAEARSGRLRRGWPKGQPRQVRPNHPEGVRNRHPGWVAKTFPGFFDRPQAVAASCRLHPEPSC